MTKFLGVVIAVLLAGCQTTSGPLDGFLKPTQMSSGVWGDGDGYQPSIQISVPLGTCNVQAYVDGFKEDYATFWNASLKAKVDLYRVKTAAEPRNKTAAYNYELYHSRRITGMRSKRPEYFAAFGIPTNAQKCAQNSFSIGIRDGSELARKDYERLTKMEK